MNMVVTGGCGFIGSELIKELIKANHQVFNFDKLTYAANPDALSSIDKSDLYNFFKVDICDKNKIESLLNEINPDAIMHLAAESHVDKSISGSDEFIETNIIGTHNLLKCSRSLYEKNNNFKFIHVSTDEVYGSLKPADPKFTETSNYLPNSPYSASKAASDHLVRAWSETFSLPVVTTHCSNNYGPWQNEEKLIPLMINFALQEKNLPVYGDGQNIRDWIQVNDHVKGLIACLEKGQPGEVYNFGGNNEIKNIDIVNQICDKLDQIKPRQNGSSYKELISFVTDRLGHDFRYAVDTTKANEQLNWHCQANFTDGLNATIDWYVDKWNK